MSNDIRDILSRLTALEGKLTPTTIKKGLNPQQDSVPQMPALFKPKKISVLGSNTDPEHPAKGYAVGSNESAEPAANKLAETMASIEEDMLSKVKKDLTTYLDKLEQKVKSDPDLMAKAVDGVEDENPAKAGKQSSHNDQEEVDENDYELTDPATVHDIEDKVNMAAAQPQSPVKTVECWPGTLFEIHGNEQDGFEIRHSGKSLPSRFKNIDDADMAIKLYKAHRDRNDPAADYVEER
jgi:hypothetical protein